MTGYWKLEVDKAGNGFAIIRFLDAPSFVDGEDATSFVQIWDHGFKNPVTGEWYIENSLTTIGQDDPVSEHNSKLWKTGTKENQDLARSRKRQMHYISNIEIVKDPKNPDNEGKTFLFKYGSKIFDKLRIKFAPTQEEIDAAAVEGRDLVAEKFDPYNFWTGANFNLRAKVVKKQRNYDDSTLSAPTPIRGSDAEIEKIWKNLHSLKAEIAPDKFKSYEDLKKRFLKVIDEDDSPAVSKTVEEAASKPSGGISVATINAAKGEDDDAPATTEDTEGLEYFKELADNA